MFKTLVPFVLLAGVLSQNVDTASSALDTLPKAGHTSPIASIANAASTTTGRGSSARVKSQRMVSTFTAAKPEESSSKKTKVIPAAHSLRELVTNLPPESRSGVQRSEVNSRDDFGSNLSCDACKVIVGQIQKMIDNQKTTEEIVKETIRVCQLYKIEDDRVCEYVVPQYQVRIARGEGMGWGENHETNWNTYADTSLPHAYIDIYTDPSFSICIQTHTLTQIPPILHVYKGTLTQTPTPFPHAYLRTTFTDPTSSTYTSIIIQTYIK